MAIVQRCARKIRRGLRAVLRPDEPQTLYRDIRESADQLRARKSAVPFSASDEELQAA